jgi:uncharacterized small protein (DUF1192 family)
MAGSTHSIDKDELMAYLDGELTVNRATLVATHLEQCAECRAWAAESRALSERLAAWEVEPAPLSLTERVTAAIPAGELKPQAREMPLPSRPLGLPRWVWATAGAVCLFLFIAAVSIPNLLRSRIAANQSAALYRMPGGGGGGAQTPLPLGAYDKKAPAPMASPPPFAISREGRFRYQASLAQSATGEAQRGGGGAAGPPIAGPMIVRTASLKLLTKDFDKTRAALEDVVRRHHGYSAQLTVGSESGSAHKLSATFRVPADQVDAAIAEIKQLAHVEQESQSGEEVTEQYVDLAARLSNARRTEQTLLEVLEKRTGRLSDVLEVEQELARVREQIERMEAELKSLQNRVSFATLQVELREEYEEQLEITPSLGRRLGNAVVEGFRTAADSLVSLVLFLLSVGPFLLLWALILFWPARYVWRRVRAAKAQK